MVKNDYAVGSEIWYKVSGLNDTQRLQLIDVVEEDIVKFNKPYSDEYLYWLVVTMQENEDTVKSFHELKELRYQIERLTWLRQRNVQVAYSEQEGRLIKQLEHVVPKRFLEDLANFVDLATDKKAALEIIGKGRTV